GEQAASFLRVTREQCQRLGRLIDEVLEVSRLERGVAQQHLVFAPVRLSTLLRKVAPSLRQELRLREQTLRERVAPDVPAVLGDERLLQMLVMHLLENAVKFTPKGGSLEVLLEAQGPEVVFAVSDTGIGIGLEHQERIFEKFYTVSSGLTRSHGGAGIGLYLVKEIVDVHKGQIRVDSRPGEGSRFEVRLAMAGED